MKVLWFSNCVLSMEQSRGSGSWLFAMRNIISGEVEMVNVTNGDVDTVVFNKGNRISEYILPSWPLKNDVPELEHISTIRDIVEKEKPDVIHIWGTEKYWALLFTRGFLGADNAILEMQGVLTSCADVFWGGLTSKECRRMVSVKSLLKPHTSQKYSFKDYLKKSQRERDVVSQFKYIATQSDWTRDQLMTICPRETKFFHSLRPIRQEFVDSKKWKSTGNEAPVIFCSFSYYSPFKGFHFLLRTLHILKDRYPNVLLKVAGPNFMSKPFYSLYDYERLLKIMIIEYRLVDNIQFCGSLDATGIINELHKSDVAVNPSLVESYSAAAAESLYIGVPTVLAYAGAMANFSSQKQVALYYNPLDYRSLASKIITLFEDGKERGRIIKNSLNIMPQFCCPDRVKERQLETYSTVAGK